MLVFVGVKARTQDTVDRFEPDVSMKSTKYPEKRPRYIRQQIVAVALLAGSHVDAQTGPGDISRQVEPVRSPSTPQLQPISTSTPKPSAVEPGATTVKVRQWVLEGNTLLTQAQTDRLLRHFTNVDVSLTQINEAAAWVQRTYEEQGWLARVVVAPQDVTEGIVRIKVMEAQLGSVILGEQGASRVRADVVQAMIDYPLAGGGALNTRLVNRGLLLADDLNGVSVTGQLKSGKAEGTTDVVVRTKDEPAMMFEAGVDNGNARSVGEWRAVGSALWLSPSGYGESYSAAAIKAEGTEFLRLGAGTPLGSSGLKGSLAVSHLNYKVVTRGSDGIVPNINGSAQTSGADVAYPLIRSRTRNLYLAAGAEQRRYNSFVDASKANDYRVNAYTIGLNGNHFDNLGGAGSNAYSVGLTSGQVKKLDADSGNDPNTLGNYSKLRWALSRQQAVARGLSLFVSLQGQRTGRKPLDSSENMSLGGPTGVRAFPVGEASGPEGEVANLELRWALSTQWLITPFYDHGQIRKRTADSLRAYSLRGAGVSVTWTGPDGWTARTTYASRLQSNPNASDTGKDQDGSLRKDRLWLSLTRTF